MDSRDVIIIGAGAAGLMCAITAGQRGRKCLVIDHAKKPAEKIRISGGGRCNFTNLQASPKNYISGNPHFAVSALNRYSQHDFIKLVEKHKIEYHEKTLGQLFCNNSSQQIIDMLLTECSENNVEIMLNTAISNITKTESGFVLDGKYSCQSLVIASGGLSIPKMGAGPFGYNVAKQFGLSIIPTRAGLVPFTLEEPDIEMAGVSTNIIASCGKTSFKEAMLFTHKGLSGPAILQISSYWNDGQTVALNLLPETNAFEYLKEKRTQNGKQEISTVLAALLPKRLAKAVAARTGIHGNIADASNTKLQKAANLIHGWQITPNGTEGYRTAEVTIGGVDTAELSSKTMEAAKVPGLYFIGEVVDVTGWLGGYNFQWAWSSGYAAGQFA